VRVWIFAGQFFLGLSAGQFAAGLTPVAGPIFGLLSTRLIEGFHFEDCLISRFYFVPNLVRKDFPTEEHLTELEHL